MLKDSRIRTNGPKAEGRNCKWIEDRPEFQKWMTTDRSMILLVSGKHGCGKSVLAKYVREHVRRHIETKTTGANVLASFFNDRRGDTNQVATETIRSLLYQVLICSPSLIDSIRLLEYYAELKQNGKEEVEWQLDCLEPLFLALRFAEGGFTFYFIIDAVDEAQSGDPIITKLVNSLVSEDSFCKFKILLTARNSSTKFTSSLNSQKSVILDVSENISDEINNHITKQFNLLRECYSKDDYTESDLDEHLNPMIKQLRNQSGGSFHWVNLELRRLEEEQSFGTPLADLARISGTSSKQMEDHYRGVFKPLDEDHEKIRRIMLQWALFAERPLTEEEFRIAVTINRNLGAYSSEEKLLKEVQRKSFQRQVYNHCGGLLEITEPQVEITKSRGKNTSLQGEIVERFQGENAKPLVNMTESQVEVEPQSEITEPLVKTAVQLMHYSARKYLLDNTKDWFFPKGHESREEDLAYCKDLAHYDLAITCITYLALQSEGLTEEGILSTEYEILFENRRFLKYAALNWTKHLNMINMTTERIAFFQPKVQHLALTVPTAMLCCRVSRLERHLDFSAAVQFHHIVSELGHNNVLQLLLENATEADVKVNDGLTHEHKETMDLLLKHGMDADARDSYDRTPLLLAARNGHMETLELLLKHDVDVNAKDCYGRTPLSSAARNGYNAVVQSLQNRVDIDVNLKDRENWTPLSLAVIYGHEKAVGELLKSKDVDVDLEVNGRSPLYLAAEKGHKEIAERLAEKWTKEVRSTKFRKLIYQAAKEGSREAAELLMSIGADKDAADEENRTPLCIAFQAGHEQIMQLLLAHGANKEAKDETGQTLLHQAASEGKMTVAELLIASGADKNAEDRLGQTPLHKAVNRIKNTTASNVMNDVAFLLNNGANIDVRDNDGRTPLHRAVEIRRDAHIIVKVLVDRGADTTTRDESGQTLLHAAARGGSEDTVTILLEQKGPGMNARDRDGRTPLHVAAMNRNIGVADLLITKKADLEIRDKDKQTPLHIAAKCKDSEIAALLVSEGANAAARDYKHQTPVQLAERNRDIAAISALRRRKVITVSA